MAEHDERDEDASRRYRELPREEPPPALDAAIRAHARRVVELHPAPLVPPTGRRQWYFPLAAAAVLVLAVAMTWHVEREQPDMVAVAPPPPPVGVTESAPAATMPSPAEQKAEVRVAPKAEPAPPKAAKPAREARSGERERAARDSAELAKQQSAPAAARSEVMRQQALVETPEQSLERIAKLRAEGRHDEADKALAEFRKRYPDFRIPEETLRRVERGEK
ncbi:MAG TPA: hypothetical protein VG873_13040 [Burkholderiales bacterium]|nr:hypothetical protein [Burkholderiales bacterium]